MRHMFGLLPVALAALLAAPAAAQQAPRAQGLVPLAIMNRLTLSPEQSEKVKAAEAAFTEAMKKANELTDVQAKRAATRSARRDYDAALNAALNADQQKQLADLRAEGREMTGMVGTPGNQLVGLDLSADQKSKIKEIGAKYQPEREKLAAELKAATDKKPIQEQITALNRKMMGEIRMLLNPDQRQKMRAAQQPKK